MTVTPVFETPYERAGVITPGLPILPHGTERHPVPGGGRHPQGHSCRSPAA